MLYQLSYETLLEADQEQVQFIPVIWRERDDAYNLNPIHDLHIKNRSESDLRHFNKAS